MIFLRKNVEVRDVAIVLGGKLGQNILKGVMMRYPDKCQPIHKIQAALAKRRAKIRGRHNEKENGERIGEGEKKGDRE